MVEGLRRARAEDGFHLAVRAWTVPVYRADAATPRHTVSLTAPWTSFRAYGPVPIPAGARPDPQGDGHMAVIDPADGCVYDFWQAREEGGAWSASWATSTAITGDGSYGGGLGARGSGLALVAGLIRPEDLRAGRIPHALIFGYPRTASDVHVPPATKTDGRSTGPEAIPMGTRVQLDPSLDLDTLDLSPYERTIARALQEYGMILGDSGGSLSLYAVHPQSYPSDPYAGILPGGTSVTLAKIPVDRFRVLATGPERTGTTGAPAPPRCGTMR